MKKIQLSGKNGGGLYALVDDEDYAELSKYRWHRTAMGYARRDIYIPPYDKRSVFMHRVVAQTATGKMTDHINGDKLDNRKSNLRDCDASGNVRNRGINKNNSSGYKGVRAHRNGLWIARITVDYQEIFLGVFQTKEIAAAAYNAAAKQHHGEFARLNGGGLM